MKKKASSKKAASLVTRPRWRPRTSTGRTFCRWCSARAWACRPRFRSRTARRRARTVCNAPVRSGLWPTLFKISTLSYQQQASFEEAWYIYYLARCRWQCCTCRAWSCRRRTRIRTCWDVWRRRWRPSVWRTSAACWDAWCRRARPGCPVPIWAARRRAISPHCSACCWTWGSVSRWRSPRPTGAASCRPICWARTWTRRSAGTSWCWTCGRRTRRSALTSSWSDRTSAAACRCSRWRGASCRGQSQRSSPHACERTSATPGRSTHPTVSYILHMKCD